MLYSCREALALMETPGIREGGRDQWGWGVGAVSSSDLDLFLPLLSPVCQTHVSRVYILVNRQKLHLLLMRLCKSEVFSSLRPLPIF